jgi:hypothetical protein
LRLIRVSYGVHISAAALGCSIILVVPAEAQRKAGTQGAGWIAWVPAFAVMTIKT